MSYEPTDDDDGNSEERQIFILLIQSIDQIVSASYEHKRWKIGTQNVQMENLLEKLCTRFGQQRTFENTTINATSFLRSRGIKNYIHVRIITDAPVYRNIKKIYCHVDDVIVPTPDEELKLLGRIQHINDEKANRLPKIKKSKKGRLRIDRKVPTLQPLIFAHFKSTFNGKPKRFP